jgi:hypothetical protein
VGRGIPETQVLGEVKPADQGARALQDDPEPGGDVDDLKIVPGVVAGASPLEQLELLAERFKKVLLTASDRRCPRSALLPCHADKASKLSTRTSGATRGGCQEHADMGIYEYKSGSPLRVRHGNDRPLTLPQFPGVPYGDGVTAAAEDAGDRTCNVAGEMV